jgi:chaperone BCS1
VQEWHQFEQWLNHALDLKPTHKKAYVIGSSYNGVFKPSVTLNDVILPGDLKQQVVMSVDEFFHAGIKAYQELGVPPFRKYLLYGEPGNGKSMLAMALAVDQLKKQRVVVFVSASDKHGADFNQIQQALEVARTNRFPVFIVVEEIDSYVTEPVMRAQVLNVLDGFEAPNNPKGSVLMMTSNHPERLDKAILRFGRIDQRWKIPPIETVNDSRLLLQRYQG